MVEVEPVVMSAAPLPIESSGRLARRSEQALSFKVGGLVERLAVREGEAVRAGQTLARLDLREIDAQVLQARSGLQKAQRDLARATQLLADSVATLEQVQDARTAVEIAEAQLEIAAFNRQYAVIVAPESGRILRRSAEPNELVQPGQPVYTLGTASGGWIVRVGLPDRDVVRLALGDAAEVRFGAFPGEVFAGRVAQIAEAAEASTGTFEIEVAVPDPAGRLKSGFIAGVVLSPSQGEPHALVPSSAFVAGEGDQGVVYTLAPERDGGAITGGTAQRRTVTVAAFTGDHLAVRGFGGGEHVVTSGAAYLEDGERVQVRAD
jgi:RND family efflux transporter MFP subunit